MLCCRLRAGSSVGCHGFESHPGQLLFSFEKRVVLVGIAFIVDSCGDQRFFTPDLGLEKNDRLGSMHTSDHRRSVFKLAAPLLPARR